MQPKSLLEQASCVLGTVIGNQALLFIENMNLWVENVINEENKDLELSIKKCAEFYNDTIPHSLHNIVTHKTLEYMNGKKFVIPQNDLNIFDFIFRCHVTKFDFLGNSLEPLESYDMIHKNLSKLKNLKCLHLNLRHMKNENINYILQGIESMKQLETFKCSDCNDNVIRVLCDNCLLINLNLECSSSVTDLSVQPILKQKNLRMLNIRDTKISKEGQKQMLLGLPHLTNISGFKPVSLLPEIGEGNVTSVQTVDCICFTECDVINLTKFCPFVKHLHIDMEKSFDLSSIANLKHFTNLSISFSSCTSRNFYKCNISTILQTRGYQITDLTLSGCIGISVTTLNIIDVSCPNLKRFGLNCPNFIAEVADFPTDKTFFQNLEHVSNFVHFSSFDPTACLIFFLRNCVNIKKVHFWLSPSFSDDDLDRHLDCNPLKSLQELVLDKCNLTVRSIYKLLTSCKELKRLGNFPKRLGIFRWPTITESDLEELYNYVQRNNLDIEFMRHLDIRN